MCLEAYLRTVWAYVHICRRNVVMGEQGFAENRTAWRPDLS